MEYGDFVVVKVEVSAEASQGLCVKVLVIHAKKRVLILLQGPSKRVVKVSVQKCE